MQAALGRLRHRESLFLQLIQKQRDQQYITQAMQNSSEEDIMNLQQQRARLELDDSGLVEQLQQLPPLDDSTAADMTGQPDDVDRIAQQVLETATEQIRNSQNNITIIMKMAETADERAKSMEVELRGLQFGLSNEQQLRENLKEECNAIAAERADLKRQLRARDLQDSQQVEAMRSQLRIRDEEMLLNDV